MKLKFLEEIIDCNKVIKGTDYIHVYDNNNNLLMRYEQISDFSDYELIDGEFSMPEPTVEERLRADVDYLLMLEE